MTVADGDKPKNEVWADAGWEAVRPGGPAQVCIHTLRKMGVPMLWAWFVCKLP